MVKFIGNSGECPQDHRSFTVSTSCGRKSARKSAKFPNITKGMKPKRSKRQNNEFDKVPFDDTGTS